jgi:hypothetical protein
MTSKTCDIDSPVRQSNEYHLDEDNMGEMVEDLDDISKLGHRFSVVDELDEIDIRDGMVHRPTYVNQNLTCGQKEEVRRLLGEFVCCFAWEYTEMSGLDKGLVEHRLPIKQGFWPYKQSVKNYSPKIIR